MQGEDAPRERAADSEMLRALCIRLIRMVSSSALDPHLYFAEKMTAIVREADSDETLRGILAGLLEWIDETGGAASFAADDLSAARRWLDDR